MGVMGESRCRREGREIFYRLDDGREVRLATIPDHLSIEPWEQAWESADRDATPCGNGYVRPSGTIYCDRPAGHEGAHEAVTIGSWARG